MTSSSFVNLTAVLPVFSASDGPAAGAGPAVLPRRPLPKYISSLINLACSWSQATRPKAVGNMSELAKRYRQEVAASARSPEDWERFCRGKQADGCMDASVRKGTDMLLAIKQTLNACSTDELREFTRDWIADTVYRKSFDGLVVVQPAVLKALAEARGSTWREATAAEESKGIDGYIGDRPVQVKPSGWDKQNATVNNVTSAADVPIVEYKKVKQGKELSIRAPAELAIEAAPAELASRG